VVRPPLLDIPGTTLARNVNKVCTHKLPHTDATSGPNTAGVHHLAASVLLRASSWRKSPRSSRREVDLIVYSPMSAYGGVRRPICSSRGFTKF
jgi:hypothetical protein